MPPCSVLVKRLALQLTVQLSIQVYKYEVVAFIQDNINKLCNATIHKVRYIGVCIVHTIKSTQGLAAHMLYHMLSNTAQT